ncbi:MAG: type II toxin-antitoxin system death-on-curing family toxin [Pirellulales bacterium]
MMRWINMQEVLAMHQVQIEAFGGSHGSVDAHKLESAITAPLATFEKTDLLPTLCDKAGALAFYLASSHPFSDGNKRVAFAAMALVLRMNGYTLAHSVDDAVKLMLDVADSKVSRDELIEWVKQHAFPTK